jgi:hypothetical protein
MTSRRSIIFALLCLLQLLGISGSVIASAIDVESIVVTGPIFTVLGLAVACGWFVSRHLSTWVFGLSVGIISIFLLILIVSLDWSPSDAQYPVSLVLLGFEIAVVPVGLLSIYRTLVVTHRDNIERKWQFSMRILFIATLIVGICCAATKLALDLGLAAPLAIAIVLCIATIFATGIVVYFVACYYTRANLIRPTQICRKGPAGTP